MMKEVIKLILIAVLSVAWLAACTTYERQVYPLIMKY
jgi:hypothetical protein